MNPQRIRNESAMNTQRMKTCLKLSHVYGNCPLGYHSNAAGSRDATPKYIRRKAPVAIATRLKGVAWDESKGGKKKERGLSVAMTTPAA